MEYRQSHMLDHFTTGIFAAMDAKKQELLDAGRTVYNLSIGTPDFEPPAHVREAVAAAALDSRNYRYSLGDSRELLDAVAAYYRKRYDTVIDTDAIVSVPGTQEGMGHLGMATLSPGDVVLLPDPGYPIYEAGSWFGGAEIHYYSLVKEHDFLPVLSEIPEDILRRTKYICVSYPSNPVGATAPKSMYEELIACAREHGFFIINDNAYSDIIFDGREGYSFLSIPGASEVGVEFFSLSKSFNVTGLRISFLIGNKSIINAMKLLRSQYDFGMSFLCQKAAVAALTGPLEAVHAQCAEYQHRRDVLCGGLRRIGWNAWDSHGTMFTWIPVPEGYTSLSCVETLLSTCGVVGTPGTAFGPKGEGYIRFALVKPAEELEEIVRIIGEHFPMTR